MAFEAYAERIMDLKEYTKENKKPKQFVQRRFQVENTHMQKVSIKKAQFASLNDKRYYFSDGVCSLPYSHPLLNDIRDIKKKYKHTHCEIQEIKYCLLQDESKAANKYERIRILKSILYQPFIYFKLDSNMKPSTVKSPIYSTKHYILNGYWL